MHVDESEYLPVVPGTPCPVAHRLVDRAMSTSDLVMPAIGYAFGAGTTLPQWAVIHPITLQEYNSHV